LATFGEDVTACSRKKIFTVAGGEGVFEFLVGFAERGRSLARVNFISSGRLGYLKLFHPVVDFGRAQFADRFFWNPLVLSGTLLNALLPEFCVPEIAIGEFGTPTPSGTLDAVIALNNQQSAGRIVLLDDFFD